MTYSKYYWLNKDSRQFLERGYLLPGVTPEQRIEQIANHAENILDEMLFKADFNGEKGWFSKRFIDYMSKGYYSLSSPVWSNYGLNRGLPISCFGLTIQDETADILRSVAEVGMLSKYGGGTAGYFGNLRGRGSIIKDNGKSNGAVSFMEMFDTTMKVISQGCYDEETEVLTDKGWKRFRELENDSTIKVAQVLNDETVEFVTPFQFFKYEVKDNLLHFRDSKNIDLLVTKNHRMIFKREKCSIIEGKYIRSVGNTFFEAEAEVVPLHRDIKFLHSSLSKYGTGLSMKERLLIALQADGSIDHTNKKALKFRFSKVRKVERLRWILDSLNLKYSENFYEKDNTYNIYVNVGEELSKTFDWVTIHDKSQNWCEEFIDEVLHWDGSYTSETNGIYFSIVEKNVDVIQQVCAISGFKTTKKVNLRESEPNKSVIYNIFISKGNYFGVEKLEPSEVYYEGNVYCVEVPTSRLIVRRHGKTVVCGNSTRRGSFAAYYPIDGQDFKEFMDIRSEGHNIQDLSMAVTVPEGWMQAMIDGDVDKRERWAMVLKKRSETGYPYILFSDNVNKHKPKAYVDKGLEIKHSQLCSEILEYTDEHKTFTCGLSSLNLLHWDEIEKNDDVINVLVMFMDTVMEEFIRKSGNIPFLEKARKFAIEHRSIGIGVLGWHSYLQSKMIPFEGLEAKMLNASIFKKIREVTLEASKRQARLIEEPLVMQGYGERFSTMLAIAPTTSSSFILGQVSPSIEALQSNYFIKDLAKGKFVYKNPYLKDLLKEKGQDTTETWQSILMKGGSVQHLDFLSDREKMVFKTFGEISQLEIIQQAAQRQKFIDQGQSLNLMIHPDVSIKEINALMIEAWQLGIKTLYYQRSANLAQEVGRKLMECVSCES